MYVENVCVLRCPWASTVSNLVFVTLFSPAVIRFFFFLLQSREGRLLTGRYSFDKLSDDCRYGAECNGIPGLGDVSLLFLFQSRDGLILQSVPDHRSLGE